MGDVQMVDVVEVSPEQVGSHAGESWDAVVSAGLPMKRVPFWNESVVERKIANWVPPSDQAGNAMPYLPLNRAWLRQIKGRAFLYRQNW